MTKATETTELALFPKLNLPSVTGVTEEMNRSFNTMYTRIEADIAALPTDMSVKANREAVASYAYKISRTKTGLDEAATGVSSDAKAIVDAVNAERRELKTTFDKLRDKARAALDAWEEAEDARKIRVRDLSMRLNNIEIELVGASSEELHRKIDEIGGINIAPSLYGEDIDALQDLKEKAIAIIEDEFENALRMEAERAELEQLRREKAEREEADRIRREQEEAEKAARMAEEQRLIDAENERIRQDEERARIAQEAKEAAAREAQEDIAAEKRKTEEAEAARVAAEEARQRAEEQAKADAFAAAVAAEQAAQKREERAAEKVRQEQRAEEHRLERERLAKEAADRERAADLAHRKKLNGEAVAGIVKACGLSEKEAQAVIVAIYKEQVPHVAINY